LVVNAERPSIVVVDDSAEVRALVLTRLRLSGQFDVVADGANGMEAIGLAYQHQPTLMLLDLSMPALDGIDALPGILGVSPHTMVVVYTGFEERGIAEAAVAMGAAGFIEKSLPIELLADRLAAVLPEHSRPRAASGGRGRGRGRDRRLSLASDSSARSAAIGDDEHDQRTLHEHLESFREVFDEAAIGMATLTLAGTVVRANRALGVLLRTSPRDLVGVDYGVLMSGRADLLEAALDDITHDISDLAVLEHVVTGWPEPRKARASLAAVRDSKGHALYVFLQVQDVTAQAAAEEQLRRSEERFRLLIEAVQEYAIFMLDTEGLVASWNPGAQRIKGYTAEEIVGQHFRAFYPDEQRASGHPEFELRVALRDGRYEEEGWRVRKDGTQFWASVLITAIFTESGQHVGFAKVTRDTTERRRAEQERIESSAALTAANAELESLAARLRQAAEEQSRVLAITAHELRTPLTVIGGSADTLALHGEQLNDAERRGLLTGMSASAKRLQRLLSDILAASRVDANSVDIETSNVSLVEVLTSVVDGVRASEPTADITLRDGVPLTVVADADRLGQAIDNLVRNALAHGAPPVSVTATADDAMALITVSDAGPGVDPSLEPRLFERFATGDRVEGTGLGLYIARELVRAQGGDAYYERGGPDQPAGAFVLSIPLASPA
jgi:PAS domain S-box-containing protein